jgi:ferredoxin-like protein FixX
MRKDALFIAVDVDDQVAGDTELARRLTEACPVDIFAQKPDGSLEIVEQNLDECVLCRLCIDAVGGRGSDHAVKIIKLYDNDAILA